MGSLNRYFDTVTNASRSSQSLSIYPGCISSTIVPGSLSCGTSIIAS